MLKRELDKPKSFRTNTVTL